MADEADIAQARMELEDEIRKKYKFVVENVKGSGFCLNCGEPVGEGHRFCDVYCRNDWQGRQK